MSAPTQKKAKISGGLPAAAQPEGFFLYEGGKITEQLRSELTRVRVGEQVKEIPVGTFSRCPKLVEVKLNVGLQTIGSGAFEHCTALKSVDIPSAVTQLGGKAFYGCTSLSKVLLNEGLQTIQNFTFAWCPALQIVTIIDRHRVGLMGIQWLHQVVGSAIH